MNIILSRKGFDSKYGGHPSPILSDGTLLSLPIPISNDLHTYTKLRYQAKSYFDILNELRPTREWSEEQSCHLDPDLRMDIIPGRDNKWRPIFGQSDAAQSHLNKQGVTIGDIFLFFGWFRQTEFINGRLSYKSKAPDQHIIYGYLQIGEIYYNCKDLPLHVLHHPHADAFHQTKKHNCLYVASKKLSFDKTKPGAGVFNLSRKRVLTKDGYTRSKWNIPDFFKDVNITYHKNAFKVNFFKSVDIGQEFVIGVNNDILEWTKDIIT